MKEKVEETKRGRRDKMNDEARRRWKLKKGEK
jgi:hypothetical protein